MGLGSQVNRRARNVRSELRYSPLARGVGAGVVAACIGTGAGLSARRSLMLASLGALAHRELSRATLRLEREIHSARDAAQLAAGGALGGAYFGEFALDGDLGRVLAFELGRRPRTVVECGCGTSTLLIASMLERNGEGRLYSIEHDVAFAERTRELLANAGLASRVDLVVAPLRRRRFGPVEADWYDLEALGDGPGGPIDLLVVDGPPSVDTWSRWPAMHVFHSQLAGGAAVLLDDGRRRSERRVALRWASEHDDVELYWVDTARGAWRLSKRREDGVRVRPGSTPLQRLARTLNPRPAGRGLTPVRR